MVELGVAIEGAGWGESTWASGAWSEASSRIAFKGSGSVAVGSAEFCSREPGLTEMGSSDLESVVAYSGDVRGADNSGAGEGAESMAVSVGVWICRSSG